MLSKVPFEMLRALASEAVYKPTAGVAGGLAGNDDMAVEFVVGASQSTEAGQSFAGLHFTVRLILASPEESQEMTDLLLARDLLGMAALVELHRLSATNWNGPEYITGSALSSSTPEPS